MRRADYCLIIQDESVYTCVYMSSSVLIFCNVSALKSSFHLFIMNIYITPARGWKKLRSRNETEIPNHHNKHRKIHRKKT